MAGNHSPRLRLLNRYFLSGWAFLLPYLAAYLGYAALDWPVHHSPAFAGPSLDQLFLVLHGAHGLLLAAAIGSRCMAATRRGLGPRLLGATVPWLLLFLFVLLPGAYLEYPGDGWEHFRRIASWADCATVTAHPMWTKASYYFFHSLVGAPGHPADPGIGLGLVSAGTAVLLAWQYYRLARAAYLSAPFAFACGAAALVLLGNNVFSFHRYYGLSSSVVAQLAAIALLRLALVTLRRPPRAWLEPARLGAGAGLALVLAFHHPQSLGIAGLGLLALLLWRGACQGHRAVAALVVAVIVTNLVVLIWYPRAPAVDDLFRPSGWLGPWLGFNLLDPSSPAFARAAVIIGAIGAVNLAAGLWLLRRNHPLGWITVVPVLALVLPAFGLPLANALATRGPGEIITFHRMLLAVPPALALLALAHDYAARRSHLPGPGRWIAPAAILVLLLVPPTPASGNRLFHALALTPEDLRLRHEAEAMTAIVRASASRAPFRLLTSGTAWEVRATDHGTAVRLVGYGFVGPDAAAGRLGFIADRWPAILVPADAKDLTTPGSVFGRLSGHWRPQHVAAEHAPIPPQRVLEDRASWRDGEVGNARWLEFRMPAPVEPAR